MEGWEFRFLWGLGRGGSGRVGEGWGGLRKFFG